MKLNYAFWFLLFITSTAFGDSDDCGYNLSVPAISYTVSDNNPTTAYTVTVSRSNSRRSRCDNFTLDFSKGRANSYNRRATNSLTGASLSYNLYKTSTSTSSLRLLSDAHSSAHVLSGSVSKNSSTSLDYYFILGTLGSTSLVRAGTYQDSITIGAYPGRFDNNSDLEKSQTLLVNIIVPKVASLSLVNTGGAYDPARTSKTLDFGELTTGEELSFDVIVLSNAGYRLSVSSSNNQIMQLLGGSPKMSAQIGYDFYSNSVLKNLTSSASSPVLISSGAGVTPMQGSRSPVRVVIQSVDSKDAGTYQDYLTFTVATTE